MYGRFTSLGCSYEVAVGVEGNNVAEKVDVTVTFTYAQPEVEFAIAEEILAKADEMGGSKEPEVVE